MSSEACDSCLRRSHVVATLAGRIEGLLQRPGDRIHRVLGVSSETLVDALVAPTERAAAQRVIESFDPTAARDVAAAHGQATICPHTALYPRSLRDLPEPPPVLWASAADRLGPLLDGPAVAIVGSRRPSAYGLEVAGTIARGLSSAGVTVVSGLAMGIDAAAHRGALRTPSPRTIAVLGGGVDVVYPKLNRQLYEQIKQTGVLLSESPPGRRPFKWTFPARNRIMAALTAMTLVVEAADPSGSLITASFAADLGRGVAAVPGRVTSSTAAGSNRLLRDGAAVIRDAADALDELFGIGGTARLEAAVDAPHFQIGPQARAVLTAIENGAPAGAIAEAADLDAAQVRVVLGQLEAQGLIRRTGIASYERTAS